MSEPIKPGINISSHLARMSRLIRHLIISCKKQQRDWWAMYANPGLMRSYMVRFYSDVR